MVLRRRGLSVEHSYRTLFASAGENHLERLAVLHASVEVRKHEGVEIYGFQIQEGGRAICVGKPQFGAALLH